MALFLTVLKIIGIIILAVLGLVLFLLLLILFAPIHYYVEARMDETLLPATETTFKKNAYFKAGFHYLLHLVRGSFCYPDQKEFVVKVLFFRVYPPKNKKIDATEASDLPNEIEEGFDNAEDSLESEKQKSEDIDKDSVDAEEENSSDVSDETLSEASDNDKDIESDSEDDEITESEEDLDEDDNKKSFIQVLKDIFGTIVKIIHAPQNVFRKIKCTISSIYARIDMIRKTLTNDIFKRAFEVTKKQFLRVLKMIMPKKCRINILVGMDDPTVTADILGAYGFLYPLLVNKIYLRPDFDRSVIQGDAHIKGRIRVFTIVWAAAVLYFNKDVKKTIRRFRRILNS